MSWCNNQGQANAREIQRDGKSRLWDHQEPKELRPLGTVPLHVLICRLHGWRVLTSDMTELYRRSSPQCSTAKRSTSSGGPTAVYEGPAKTEGIDGKQHETMKKITWACKSRNSGRLRDDQRRDIHSQEGGRPSTPAYRVCAGRRPPKQQVDGVLV